MSKFPASAPDGATFTTEGVTYHYNSTTDEWSEYLPEVCRYDLFWSGLLSSKFYKILRRQATESLPLSVTFCEFTAYMLEARDGKADEHLIQSLINQIFLLFTDAYHPAQDPEVMPEFAEIFDDCGMDVHYTFPTKEWVENHFYDPISNSIAGPQPFPSWELVLARWEPPFMPPEDDKQYIWDEDVKNWVESEPPYPSWHVAEGRWQAPVYKPDDGKEYTWSEETLSWVAG